MKRTTVRVTGSTVAACLHRVRIRDRNSDTEMRPDALRSKHLEQHKQASRVGANMGTIGAQRCNEGELLSVARPGTKVHALTIYSQ